jgi:hypothetical protein
VDVLALHHAPSERDEALEEGHPQEVDHALDRWPSGVEVDRRAGDGQGVDARGAQGGVDRREPPALRIADQVGAAAERVEGRVELGDVVLDAGVLGGLRRAAPVECVDAAEPGGADRLHLALLRAVVDDRGRVTRLRRDDKRRHEGATRGLAEAPEQREWRAQDDLVRRRPRRRLAPHRDVPQARGVRRDVQRRRAAGQRARPVLADPCGRRPPGGHRAHGNVGPERRRSSVAARGGGGRRTPRAGRRVRPLERQRPWRCRYGGSARSPERAHPRRSRRPPRSAWPSGSGAELRARGDCARAGHTPPRFRGTTSWC